MPGFSREKAKSRIVVSEVPARAEPDLNLIHHPNPDHLQVTWIGHATFLLQLAGKNILTDPIYSDCCAPVYLPNLRRRSAPGIPFSNLPPIDYVVISHDHYDHFDQDTIRRLGKGPVYLIPQGMEPLLRRMKLPRRVELDWWQSTNLDSLAFHCVPAQHCSGRGVFDRNRRLWGGWVIEGADKKIFFAGDSGYSDIFLAIGGKFGPVDLSLLPIGAYSPRALMKPVHMNPAEAVQIHLDLCSRQSIASHWGTFRLTSEPMDEPPRALAQALADKNIPAHHFLTPALGETITIE